VVGVRYEFDDEFYDVYASRHVVLSAGAEGTPHFLQHNGIGPADLLNRYGIPIRAVNNHIGQNLAAHAAIPLAYVANQPIFTSPDSSNGQFFKGHLTTPLAEGFPDIELEFFFGLVIRNFDSPLTGPDQLYLTTPTVNGAYPFLSVSVEVVNPQWRGSVNITGDKFSFPSSVDYGWPSDPNVYATSQDFAKHQYGFAKVRSFIYGNNSFARKYFTNATGEVGPGIVDPANQFSTDLLYGAYHQHDIYHLTGGMNLGTATNINGAVRGVSGLSVCDNSLIPHPPNGNPTTTMLALCEYVSDRIKALY